MWRQASSLAKRRSRLGFAQSFEVGPRKLSTAVASSSEELRESRRVFLLSLQEMVTSFPKYTATVRKPVGSYFEEAVTEAIPIEDGVTEDKAQPDAESVISHVPPNRSSNALNKYTADQGRRISASIRGREDVLWDAVRKEDVATARRLVKAALENDQVLSPRIVVRLFYLLVDSDPISSYLVLTQSRERNDSLSKAGFQMYLKLCSSVGSIEIHYEERLKVKGFVRKLIQDIFSMDDTLQQELLPKLITSLATQRNVRLGAHANDLYQHMVRMNYKIRPGWLKQLLSLSRYNRQDDLPYDDIMERLAASDTLPHPLPVIAAVHNMFPFTSPEKLCRALRAVLYFQSKNVLENFPMYSRAEEIHIDLDCLELISSGAAQTGSAELILLVWDLLEQCGYTPTEAIYENTVVAFASGGENIQAAFGAIIAMKDAGYEVPRSLLRSFSLALRSVKDDVDASMLVLAATPELQALETFNAMMSCYAERGDVKDVLGIMETMEMKQIVADSNSYSFAMESLGKNIHRWKKKDDPFSLQQNLDHADRILGMMEQNGIVPSRDILRNYVELLCITGESKTADLVIDDMLNMMPNSVCSKTLYRTALMNAEEGDFSRARELASHISDNIPTLKKKIRSIESRYRHVKETIQARD